MNTLSWFLYAADVLPTIATTFFGFGVILMVGMIVMTIIKHAIIHDQTDNLTRRSNPERFEYAIKQRESLSIFMYGKYVVAGFLLILIAALVPSKSTFYLIAASELGETVIQDESTRELMEDVQEVIQLQIQNLTPSVD